MSISPGRIKEIVSEFGKNEANSGAPEVQCAILTERIVALAQYVEKFKKDFSAKRAVVKLVAQRRSMLNYLKSRDRSRYLSLISALGLRK
jgi:small subunit ribosomal protein S15